MKEIIKIDLKDYEKNAKEIYKHAVKVVLKHKNKVFFLHSKEGDYKLIGGGIEKGEDVLTALKRETMEESGYEIDEKSLVEVGIIIERRKDHYSDCIWNCITYLYEANILNENQKKLDLTPNEQKHQMALVEFTIPEAYEKNKVSNSTNPWVYREIKTLEYLIKKGNF